MQIEKIYIGGKTVAALTCPFCGYSKQLDLSTIPSCCKVNRVKCRCGNFFHVFFERRRQFRKCTSLRGSYSLKSDMFKSELPMVVVDISRSGLCFTRHDRNPIAEGDILQVKFTLDDTRSAMIVCRLIARNIKDSIRIGAEFLSLDEHTSKELGFYLMSGAPDASMRQS